MENVVCRFKFRPDGLQAWVGSGAADEGLQLSFRYQIGSRHSSSEKVVALDDSHRSTPYLETTRANNQEAVIEMELNWGQLTRTRRWVLWFCCFATTVPSVLFLSKTISHGAAMYLWPILLIAWPVAAIVCAFAGVWLTAKAVVQPQTPGIGETALLVGLYISSAITVACLVFSR